MSNRKIIGLTGLKYSGKDTAADMLYPAYEKIALASPLKAMLATLLSQTGLNSELIHKHINGFLKEKPIPQLCGRSARFAMQKLGTEYRQMIGEDLWTNILLNKIKMEPLKNFVISDVRFQTEVDALRQVEGVIIRINRPMLNFEQDLHRSEQEISELEVDFDIQNDGTLDDLRKALYAIVEA